MSALKDLKPTTLAELAAQAFSQLFEVLLDLLKDPPPARRRIELRVLLQELGYKFIDKLPTAEEQIQTAASLVAGQRSLNNENDPQSKNDDETDLHRVDPMSTAYLIQELQFLGREGLGAKLHKLADALTADTGPRPTCVLVLPSKEVRGGIVAGQLALPPIPSHLPIVILDATCDRLLYDLLFHERSILHVRVEVQQTATIIQTIDHRYPAGTLGDPNSPSINRLMDIVDKHKEKNPTHKIAVIVQKHLIVAKRHVKARILESVAEDDVRFFWSNRGENTLKDYDALFVLGAPELHPFETEARARAFMSREAPASWEQPYDYQLVPSPNQTSSEGYIIEGDGSRLAERGYQQGGPSSVFYAFHQAEYAQSMLRLRPYDPGKQKTIYFFSNVYIPYLTMNRTTEDELLERAPALLVRARELLKNVRASGNKGLISQKELADMLGVSKAAVTQMKKKYGQTDIWNEIALLLNPTTAGQAAGVPTPSNSST